MAYQYVGIAIPKFGFALLTVLQGVFLLKLCFNAMFFLVAVDSDCRQSDFEFSES